MNILNKIALASIFAINLQATAFADNMNTASAHQRAENTAPVKETNEKYNKKTQKYNKKKHKKNRQKNHTRKSHMGSRMAMYRHAKLSKSQRLEIKSIFKATRKATKKTIKIFASYANLSIS